MNPDTLEPSETALAISQQYRRDITNPSALNSHLADPETIDILFDAVRSGLNDRDSCAVAKINPATLRQWQMQAEENPEGSHARFLIALKDARAGGKLACLKRIHRAGEKDQHWTANAWLLERTDPEQFALRKDDSQTPKVIVQIGARDADVQVNVITVSPQPVPALGETSRIP